MTGNGDLTQIINTITQVILFGVPTALVLLLFFWNMSQLVFQSSNAEKMKDARARIFWSLIGMFVLFSLVGILALLQNTLFHTTNQRGTSPSTVQNQNPFGGGEGSAFGSGEGAGFGTPPKSAPQTTTGSGGTGTTGASPSSPSTPTPATPDRGTQNSPFIWSPPTPP